MLRGRTLGVLAAFAAIYAIWGSTYLAIAYGLESLPPLLMMGTRFLAAGAVLYGWAAWRRGIPPSAAQWRTAFETGALLFLATHGLLAWAQQRIPSGLAALLGATVPLWMVGLEWGRRGGARPGGRVLAGVGAGLVGVAMLVLPGGSASVADPAGAGAVLAGALAWSVGSLRARSARLPDSLAQATGMQLLGGGTLLVAAGLAVGEAGDVGASSISVRSMLSWAYLVVLGSIVAFSAYAWLLRVSTPARVATHAFVNPAVAVLLGWWVGEAVGPAMLLATALIVAAVFSIAAPAASPAGDKLRGASRIAAAARSLRQPGGRRGAELRRWLGTCRPWRSRVPIPPSSQTHAGGHCFSAVRAERRGALRRSRVLGLRRCDSAGTGS